MEIHKYLFLLSFLYCGAAAAQAAPDPQRAQDARAATLEQRVQKLSEELRCLVCQNQSLADSSAELALDLKNQVREKLTQGASEKEVIAFMTERYGDFVLYRPPMKATTLLLWFGPALLLLGGLIALFMRLRARARTQAEPQLSAEERARAAALLEGAVGADTGKPPQ
jgi:cytochrome c-type biogenesis protein CcmH/NrfF